MAEQIRSFWSHLCGFIGAIFGMIAGGTLVTIDRANAEGYSDYTYDEVLSNGAVVNYYYGRRYDPYFDYFDSKKGAFCAKHCSMATGYDCDDFSRYYVTFKGCADGYYASGAITSPQSVTKTVGCAINPQTQVVSSATVGLCGEGVCIVRPICENNNMKAVICEGTYDNGYGPYDVSWKAEPTEQTNGLCIKCPDYDTVYNNYTGKSISGTATSTFATGISTCFMSKATGRSDAIEHDGAATGTFVWTSDCHYVADSTGGSTGGGTTGGGATVDMSTNGVFNNLKDIFENELDLDMQYVQLETKLMGDGLDIDSVGAVSLIMAIEEEYDITFDDEEVSQVFASGTFGDLVRMIQEKVG